MKPIVKGTTVFVDTETRLDKKTLDRYRKEGISRIVSLTVGLDHIDTKHAKKIGLLLENTPKINFHSTAEYAIAALFYHAREYPRKEKIGTELHNKTAAIIGYGKVGKRIATILKAIGLEVLPFDANHSEKRLNKILGESDFIFICLPLNPQTAGFFDYKTLKHCKKNSVIFNFAREALVENDAMCLALQEKRITAYYVDERLPHKAFVCTPHIAWKTKEVLQRKHEYANGK